ncbi:hypothetical protein, partial [Klebsiella oxytoca]|uniref:hypothetical protein n=1 Tax=Klebsiella oxytoca TaxID=571 RepID=UPI001B2FF0A4
MLMIQLFGSAGNSNFAFFQNLADVPAILGYGINGLGFLLDFLGYLLIRREQNRERPNMSILNSLYIFMGFSILLSVIGLTSQA